MVHLVWPRFLILPKKISTLMFVINYKELLFSILSFDSTIKKTTDHFFLRLPATLAAAYRPAQTAQHSLCDLADARSRWYITTLEELFCSGKQRIAKILLRATSTQTAKEWSVTVVGLRISFIYHCIYSRQLARECCRQCH